MVAAPITQLIAAQELTEGAGVTVRRTLGTAARRHLDPFLLLDHFSSADPDDYIAGFPDHPHRGFITLTYMLNGHMLHRDSMGHAGDLRAGGAQWMKAASGVIHSEMPQQSDGLMRGFQLWINLPAAEKLADPAYRELAPADIPAFEADGATVRVLAGRAGAVTGPIDDPHTALRYLDVTLAPGTDFATDVPAGHAALLYTFEGSLILNGTTLPAHHLAVLDTTALTLQAGDHGARCILVSGRPLGEPIVQYGPFVMNTREEIEQALADYRDGRLVRNAAVVEGE